MKEKELRSHSSCSLCGKKILSGGTPMFWVITIERFGVNLSKIKRQDGLSMMMGSAMLASVMGPDEDLAEPLTEAVTLTICEACGTSQSRCIASLGEIA